LVDNSELYVLSETMKQIRNRISEIHLLEKISCASGEDIFHLKEQYGELAVDIGIEIIEAYTSLNELVVRLHAAN